MHDRRDGREGPGSEAICSAEGEKARGATNRQPDEVEDTCLGGGKFTRRNFIWQ